MVFVKRVLILLMLAASVAHAQVNRYMIFFTDKTGSPYTINAPEQFLTERAINRRIKQNITVTGQDIPVKIEYIQGVSNTGATILYATRWMNGILVECEAPVAASIESLAYVHAVEFVAPGGRPPGAGERIRTGNRIKETKETAITTSQLSMIGLDQMHNAGFRGEGISIAVLDAGFPGVTQTSPFFGHLFSEGRIHPELSYDFVHDKVDVFAEDDHGTRSLSIMGAYQPGVFIGGAHKADYLLFITEDDPTEYRIEEYNWLFAAERADSLGADIIATSLGYNDFDEDNLPAGMSFDYERSDMNGKTAVVTQAAGMAADRGMVVVCSAGNEGVNSWQVITAPADAENILAVGGTTSAQEKFSSSSIGPAADGRVKPDVAALGTGVAIITANGNITSGSGTSYSAPLVASMVAGTWQRNPELTNKELIDFIKSTASQSENPDNLLGYGIPNFKAIVNKIEWIPQEKVFEVFPNPIEDDTLNIRPRSPEEIDTCTIEIVSAEGKMVERKTISFDWLNRTYTADCSLLSPGVYYLHIRTAVHSLSFRLVKI